MLIGAVVAPVTAVNEERYSYITVESITIHLVDERAVITIDYAIDDGIRLLVLLLGKSDLKDKVLQILDYPDATVYRADLDRAIVFVDNASYDYGSGSYWFPTHRFKVLVPSLTVITPQDVRFYKNVQEFPNGIGYFSTI